MKNSIQLFILLTLLIYSCNHNSAKFNDNHVSDHMPIDHSNTYDDSIVVTIPELFELMNIGIALTQFEKININYHKCPVKY